MSIVRHLWHYRAIVKRVIDGDTIDAEVDCGFSVTTVQRLRLASINCPETRGDEKVAGLSAKAFVESQLPVGSEIVINTAKDDSFGRYIAQVWYGSDHKCLNTVLVEHGYAKYKEY
jgi:micrococcal nuclease